MLIRRFWHDRSLLNPSPYLTQQHESGIANSESATDSVVFPKRLIGSIPESLGPLVSAPKR
jgi:hypothetical protein